MNVENSGQYVMQTFSAPTGPWPEPVILVDRDGVINYNRAGHVLSWEAFTFEEGSLEALRLLHESGYRVIVITNQGAIGRGLVSAAQIDRINARMAEVIEEHGGHVDAVYYCPHHPKSGCACRKPKPTILFEAADRHKFKLPETWLVGDYVTDIQAALAAGCKPLLVLTGRGREALESIQNLQGEPHSKEKNFHFPEPLTVRQNLLEAVKHILSNGHVEV